MHLKRAFMALVSGAIVAGGLAVGPVVPASGAYASNGEPVWIPRNSADASGVSRADNRALVRIGNVVYVGGDFTELAPDLGAPALRQGFLAAFDATSGVPIASFAPRLDGKVYALAASDDGTTLYVGGAFTTVGGQALPGFAALDAATGALRAGVTQRPAEGEVRALAKDGSTLYVGGAFQRFGNTNKKSIARIDISQPAMPVDNSWAPQFAGGMVASVDVPPNRSRVYVGGRFSSLAGVTVGKLVALDPVTAALDATFSPPYNTTKQPVEDVEAQDAKVFVAFGGGYNRFTQFSANGTQEYAACGDGDVQEVHLVDDGATLLVGGHYTGGPKRNCTLAVIPTPRVAQYDVTGAVPVPVTPTVFPNLYANLLGVWEFLGTSLSETWVAGDFLKASSRNTGGLAHFVDGSTYTDSKAPTMPGAPQVFGATPGSLTVTWAPATDNKVVAGYYVSAGGVREAVSTATTAVVAGLDPGTAYSLQVEAFDAKLNTSAPSVATSGTTPADVTAPQPPTGLRVLSGSTGDLVLGWNAATDDGTVTGYRVLADGQLLTTTSALTANHTGLAPGSQHQYSVVAVDAGGNLSAPSATLAARAHTVVLGLGSTWRYWDRGSLPDYSWREAAYDDSAWAAGAAPLGYGKAYVATTLGYGPSAANRYLTSYARTTFTLADPTGITNLTLRLRALDGGAVFVNGRLAYNDNLPAALEPDLPALTSRSAGSADVMREFRVPVTAGMLAAGTNVVSVELHKFAANATYLAMDAELSVGLPPGGPPPAPPAAPTGLGAAAAGTSVQLAWTASAGAVGYEVIRNGAPLAAPTTTSYTDTAPPAGVTITYAVRAVDAAGQTSAWSNETAITVTTPDTVAPSKPGKPTAGAVGPDTVELAWTPSTDNVAVTGYQVLRGGQVIATTPGASFTDTGLTTSTTFKYTVVALDAAGNRSAVSGSLSVTTAAPPPASLLLGPSTPWSYTDTRIDLGTAWREAGYATADPAWKTGLPQLGFGDGDEATVLGFGGTTAKTAVFTWYFRAAFDVVDPAATTGLVLDLVRDDGAAVYVNGVEVFRSNLPAGDLTFTTKASSNLGGADERTPVPFTVPATALVPGRNVIAVELHNYGAANADASFVLTGTLA